MRRIREPTDTKHPTTTDEAAIAVRGGQAYLADVERRLAPYFKRVEPRQRAIAYLQGLLSPAERKNSWQLAEVSGDATPYALQHLLRRALWDADAVRDALQHYLAGHLSDPDAVLVVDETGFLKKGRHSAGVARQYSGTAGRIGNCQIGVFVAYASRHGQALLDRELYLPEGWTKDRARCRLAGVPEGRQFATKPQLAQQMLARAFAGGIPAQWVTGDSVYGDDRRLRMWLESCPQAYVLAVSGKEYVWLDWQQRQVKTILAALPENGWTRLSAGDGSKGPRWHDWRRLPLADPMEGDWRRWLLVRRSISEPSELRAYVVFAPQDATLADLVRVAGTRWVVESCFEAAKGEVGLDHYEVRSWTGWYRHITLAMWAFPADGVARRGTRRGNPQKKPAARGSTEQPSGLQSPTGARLLLSVPEIRRLLWRLVLVVEQTVEHMVAWSVWRRCHQSLAKYYHYQRRGALAV